MTVEVRVNELPESVAEGTLVLWHKQPGEAVTADEALAEIETDKVVLEIAAPGTGILGQQLRKKGEAVKRGDVIATIEPASAAAKSPKAQGEQAPAKVAAVDRAPAPERPKAATPATPASQPAAKEAPARVVPTPATAEPSGGDGGKPDAYDGLSPSVRRLL